MPPDKDADPVAGRAPSRESVKSITKTEPPSVQVRRMGESDLDAVLAIAAESPEASLWSRQSYTKLLNERYGLALVAEEVVEQKSRVTGFLVGRVIAAEAEVLNLAVPSNRRQRGHAKALLQAALKEFADRAAEWVFLEVRESNAAAIAFYEKNLFSKQGLRKGYYRHPDEAAVVMGRKLES